MTSDTNDTARKAAELRLAGVSYAQIATQLEYENADAASTAIRHVLDVVTETPEQIRQQELGRLDAMLVGLWAKARRGDVAAVDRAMRLTARRARLLGVTVDGAGDLRRTFDASVTASTHAHEVDAALIEAGRKIADRVDDAIATCEGQELTKALYLMPHLVNILREMLATPAARKAAGLTVEGPRGKLASLPPIKRGPQRSA